MSTKHVSAEHGVICSMPFDKFGFFGWPSVARTDGGKLVAIASGLRFAHVCPWGKTVLFTSDDEGATWSPPRILNDTPLDDRDAGIISLGGEKLLATWFSADRRPGYKPEHAPEGNRVQREAVLNALTEDAVTRWSGSWVRTSIDGEAWSDYLRCPVNTPHGPIRLDSGDLLYFGKQWYIPGENDLGQSLGDIRAVNSRDDGVTWTTLGSVPLPSDMDNTNVGEPHVVETASGRLIGLIRYVKRGTGVYDEFNMFQTESDDDGKTWTEAHLVGYGSPPHMIRHSSGAIVCVYGSRREPFGECAMFSYDDGKTWDMDWMIHDSPPKDLGYPGSVELPDGRIMTVYYQYLDASHKNAALQYSVWEMPGR
jgi:sialidase-1